MEEADRRTRLASSKGVVVKSELRVHGVSGTPARNMLYTDPVAETSSGEITVWGRPFISDEDARFETTAFHWSGLTSGKWYTAFWILFGPFMLANVAGWMAITTGFWSAAFVRLAGLAITALFVAQAVTAAVATPALWLETHTLWGFSPEVTLAVLAGVVGLGYWFIIFFFVSRSNERTDYRSRLWRSVSPSSVPGAAPGDPGRDPLARRITSEQFLERHRVVDALRRCHLGLGLAVIGTGAAAVAGGTLGDFNDLADVAFNWGVAGAAALAVIVVLLGVGPLWLRVSGLGFGLGVVPFGLSVAALLSSGGGGRQPEAAHGVILFVVVALGACAVGLVIRCGWRAMGAIALAAQFGGVLGIAITMTVERLLGIDADHGAVANGAGWVAVGMLVVIEVIAAWAAINLMRPPPSGLPVGSDGRAAVRRIVIRGAEYIRIAAGIGLVALVLVFVDVAFTDREFLTRSPNETDIHFLVIGAAITVGVLALAGLFARGLLSMKVILRSLRSMKVILVALFTSGLAIVWWRVSPRFGVAESAAWLAAVVPGAFLFNSIVRGVREGRDSRRRVGILWDLGSFWPRWFHPLAPPDYGAYAVLRLVDELDARPREVLAGHSQGSVVAAMALHHGGLPCGFISYGSQLGWLYPQLFPTAGFDDLVVSVNGGRRWVNLLRDTDQLGGHPVPLLGSGGNKTAGPPPGHSTYEATDEYRAARDFVTGSGSV